MLTRATQYLLCIISVIAALLLTSCQKGVDIDLDNPPPIPEEVKDSTLLVKSITHVWDNGKDTMVETYFYDTANKKIILSWTDNFFMPGFPDVQSDYNGLKADLGYNNKALLSNAVYHYPATYKMREFDYSRIDIVYDEENIVKEMSARYFGGAIERRVITKDLLPNSGYKLTWVEGFLGGETIRKATFTKEGRNIVNQTEYLYEADTSPSGDTLYSKNIRIDSLIYDNTGLVKILTSIEDTLKHTIEKYTSYEFSGRLTKGDQLYKQREIIMNGIANIPFQDGDGVADAFGMFSFYLEYEWHQYYPYPIQHARVRMWDGRYDEFTTSASFDSKNRLTKVNWFVTDLILKPSEYLITYYK